MRLEIGIDANDIELLASFWQAALSYQRGDGDGEQYLNLRPVDGSGPVVFLQKVPERKSTKNRMHLDIYTAEAEELITQLVALGGTVTGPRQSGGGSWYQVMADPEGNEFCIMAERKLSS